MCVIHREALKQRFKNTPYCKLEFLYFNRYILLDLLERSMFSEGWLMCDFTDMFWYRDGDELIQLTSDERFTMSDNDRIFKIHLSNCELSDAGLYLCVAVNQHGTCQHRFTVKVPGIYLYLRQDKMFTDKILKIYMGHFIRVPS